MQTTIQSATIFLKKNYNFAPVRPRMTIFVNIHTHRPTGDAIEPTSTGVHPWHVEHDDCEHVSSDIATYDAIGETGLDFACDSDRSKQREAFVRQLQIAEETGKPVVIHCVKAFEPVMEELARHDLRAVIFHGFIGSPEQAARAVARGYYLSFGERTFASPKTIEALQHIPLGQMFLETDDSPIAIEEIYGRVADLRGISVDSLSEEMLRNYEKVFGRDEQLA